MKDTIVKYWKQILAALMVVALALAPQEFVIYNLDYGFKLITAITGLLLARVAKSAYDSWQSKSNANKKVSVSRFMSETESEIGKAVVHASQILSIAIIIAVAISKG